jgi:hypothetical protein
MLSHYTAVRVAYAAAVCAKMHRVLAGHSGFHETTLYKHSCCCCCCCCCFLHFWYVGYAMPKIIAAGGNPAIFDDDTKFLEYTGEG